MTIPNAPDSGIPANHILLVGHRTAGKTTLGAALAARLDMPFHDVDRAIEQATGRAAADLARTEEPRFRALERATLDALIARDTPAVIACGAGCARFPDGVFIIEIFREGWEETARAERGPLLPALTAEDEARWMRDTRSARYRAAAHARLHIARGTGIDIALDDLMHIARLLAAIPGSIMIRKSWIVPPSPGALDRAAADARIFGAAGVELRSDITDIAPPPACPVLASLRTPDAAFLPRHADAAAFDCDIRYLDLIDLPALLPRPLILSLHADRFATEHLDAFAAAMERARRASSTPADMVTWKYAPAIGSWRELRASIDAVEAFRRTAGPGTFLPQGADWRWMRVLLANGDNAWNYIGVHDAADAAPAPPDIAYFLPHFYRVRPALRFGLIGAPVDHSIGDMRHRALGDGDPIPSEYVKIPVHAAEIDAALATLRALDFTGVSVTAPLKRDAARATGVDNPEALAAGNTLTRRRDRWTIADTDEAGMRAALEDIERAGVAPGPAMLFGRGGVAPAVTRALAGCGWKPVTAVSARAGWRGDESPCALVVNAAGPAVDALTGAPASAAWLDLHYRDIRALPADGRVYRNGRAFFEAQAAAQRAAWAAQAARDAAELEEMLAPFPADGRERARELLRRLLDAFPLRRFTVDVAGRELDIVTAEDIEQLIARITDEEFSRDERLPYWAELWHSAVAVAEHVAAHPALVAGRDVLEVGCGLGVPGIVAALAGARVTFSDNDPAALRAAELNHLRNAPEAEAAFTLLDFREPPRRTWPVVIAADVLYEKRYLEPFAAFLDASLAPGGTAIIAEPNRHVAESFFTSLAARGFRLTRHEHRAFLHGRFVEVSVWEGEKKGDRSQKSEVRS